MTCIHHCCIRDNSFIVVKILCVPHIIPPSPLPLVTTDVFTVSIVLPFLECHYSWSYTVCGLISLSNRHKFELTLAGSEVQGNLTCCSPWGCRVGHNLANRMFTEVSSLSFCGLIAHFFLAPSNIPLFGYTTVQLSTCLLNNILVASKFWQSW